MRVVPKYSEIFLPCSPMKQHFNARTEVAAGRGGGRSGRNRPACRVVTLSCWPSPRQHGRETQLCRDRRSFLIYVLRCVCGLSLSLPPLLGLGISSESHFCLRAPRRVGVAVRGGVGRSAERRAAELPAGCRRRETGRRRSRRGTWRGRLPRTSCQHGRQQAPPLRLPRPCPEVLGALGVEARSGSWSSQWHTPLTAAPTQGDRERVPALTSRQEGGTGCRRELCPRLCPALRPGR